MLKKNKGFSLINIFGLSQRMACTLLIMLWVQDEVNLNRFHEKYDNMYQVLKNPMNNFLHDYAYRITIQWWPYVLAAVLALLIAFLNVSIQEIKETLTNLINSLRIE
ncbi:MAG: hypothetical protein ABI763_06785 [Bacteroidota bacterium]